jgi:hypothetical protein
MIANNANTLGGYLIAAAFEGAAPPLYSDSYVNSYGMFFWKNASETPEVNIKIVIYEMKLVDQSCIDLSFIKSRKELAVIQHQFQQE